MFALFLVGVAALNPRVVPVSAEEAIRARVPSELAYIPTTRPRSYRYASWMQARKRPRELTIWFRWRNARDRGLGFNVGEGCPEFGSSMRRFRFRTRRVQWSTTNTNAQAWRCANRGRHTIYFYVSAPGYMLAGAPSPRALALMIASARHVAR